LLQREETVLELVDLIYRAAGDPAGWNAVLARLGQELDGTAGSIHHQHSESQESGVAMAWNIDPADLESYMAHFSFVNPWMTRRKDLLAPGMVVTSQMLCPDEEMDRTEFCNDWLLPQKLYHGCGVTVVKDGPVGSKLSLFRPKNRGQFGDAECQLLRVLTPHLQRALELHNRVQRLEEKASAACDALDRLPQGVILLDAQQRPVFVNGAAQALLAAGDGLRLERNGLRAAVPEEHKRLAQLLAGAVATGRGQGIQSGGTCQISRDQSSSPLLMFVTPLRTGTVRIGPTIPVAGVFLSDPDRGPRADAEITASLFGLTRAEARLSAKLASGRTLEEAAEELSVSLLTVRSQLKSIFGKTATSRQSELVRLLISSPAALAQCR